jgi:hypothetical protein
MEIYIAKNKTQMGPYDLGQIVQMLQTGILERYDLYWHEGMLDWAPLGAMGNGTGIPQSPQRVDDGLNTSGTATIGIEAQKTESPDHQLHRVIAGGYICAVISLLLLPPAFGIAGLVLGIVSIVRGKIGHGVAIIVLAISLAIIGMIFGSAMIQGKIH